MAAPISPRQQVLDAELVPDFDGVMSDYLLVRVVARLPVDLDAVSAAWAADGVDGGGLVEHLGDESAGPARVFSPRSLADLLDVLVGGPLPDTPLSIGW